MHPPARPPAGSKVLGHALQIAEAGFDQALRVAVPVGERQVVGLGGLRRRVLEQRSLFPCDEDTGPIRR
jgi:hypothetical protein